MKAHHTEKKNVDSLKVEESWNSTVICIKIELEFDGGKKMRWKFESDKASAI